MQKSKDSLKDCFQNVNIYKSTFIFLVITWFTLTDTFFWFDTIKVYWPIVFVEGLGYRLSFQNIIVCLSLKVVLFKQTMQTQINFTRVFTVCKGGAVAQW